MMVNRAKVQSNGHPCNKLGHKKMTTSVARIQK